MDAVWDGVTRATTLKEDAARQRLVLADAAKAYDWPTVLEILGRRREWVNTWRLDGASFYTPLHQAAHGGAPLAVVHRLIALGAWRTLQNAHGERAVDVAARMGRRDLLKVLTPEYRQRVPLGVLLKIQVHFHAVIQGRAAQEIAAHALRLPELEPLLELEQPRMWFAVPGMYGGFNYWLAATGAEAMLVSESWSRVVDGSGQRHEITAAGSRLAAEGFV